MGNSCCSKNEGEQLETNYSLRALEIQSKLKSQQPEIIQLHQPDPSRAAPVENMNKLHSNVVEAISRVPNFDFKLENRVDTETGLEMGPFKFTDGSTYLGEIFNKKKHGYGEIVFPDGSVYHGYFKDDKYEGMGRLIQSDGEVYQGEWQDDKAQGYGEFYNLDGSYQGMWDQDKQNGRGTETWQDGSKYSGDFKNSKKHGQGTFEWSNGCKYEGGFLNGEIEGKGNNIFIIYSC